MKMINNVYVKLCILLFAAGFQNVSAMKKFSPNNIIVSDRVNKSRDDNLYSSSLSQSSLSATSTEENNKIHLEELAVHAEKSEKSEENKGHLENNKFFLAELHQYSIMKLWLVLCPEDKFIDAFNNFQNSHFWHHDKIVYKKDIIASQLNVPKDSFSTVQALLQLSDDPDAVISIYERILMSRFFATREEIFPINRLAKENTQKSNYKFGRLTDYFFLHELFQRVLFPDKDSSLNHHVFINESVENIFFKKKFEKNNHRLFQLTSTPDNLFILNRYNVPSNQRTKIYSVTSNIESLIDSLYHSDKNLSFSDKLKQVKKDGWLTVRNKIYNPAKYPIWYENLENPGLLKLDEFGYTSDDVNTTIQNVSLSKLHHPLDILLMFTDNSKLSINEFIRKYELIIVSHDSLRKIFELLNEIGKIHSSAMLYHVNDIDLSLALTSAKDASVTYLKNRMEYNKLFNMGFLERLEREFVRSVNRTLNRQPQHIYNSTVNVFDVQPKVAEIISNGLKNFFNKLNKKRLIHKLADLFSTFLML